MIVFQNIRMVSVQDWDDLVVETYGRPYSFQQQDGCKYRGTRSITVPDDAEDYENYTIPEDVNGEEMGVSFAAWLARDPNQKLNSIDEWDRDHGLSLFWHRNFYPDIQMIVNDLHTKGLVPEGDYMIDW